MTNAGSSNGSVSYSNTPVNNTNTGIDTSTATGTALVPLVERIADFIERYVLVPSPEIYQLISLWVLSTYLMDIWEYTGYLFFHSAEPQSGKSRALEVLELLVSNSSGILVSPTESVLFRMEDKTQFMDEIDTWTNKEDLKGVLNAGFRRGGIVPRMEQAFGSYVLKEYHVFNPRVMAGIGVKVLDQTTLDRTFAIGMRRQTATEKREPFRVRKISKEIEQLKTEILNWAQEHRSEVTDIYDGEFEYMEEFKDRTIDILQPLAAIMEVMYRGHQGLWEARVRLMHAIGTTRKSEDAIVIRDHQILNMLFQHVSREQPLIGTATELVHICCNGSKDRPSREETSATLRRYGFRNKSIRMNGESKKRYELSFDALDDLIQRYCREGEPN